MNDINKCISITSINKWIRSITLEGKSRKYQGAFEVKRRVKT